MDVYELVWEALRGKQGAGVRVELRTGVDGSVGNSANWPTGTGLGNYSSHNMAVILWLCRCTGSLVEALHSRDQAGLGV